MDRSVYQEMAAIEDHHWWFAGRRTILAHVIQKFLPPSDATLLEAGCGSGGNLCMLQHFGRVEAFEYDADARSFAQGRGLLPVREGSLPHGIPADLTGYDLIALLDVLEHIEADAEALSALHARLKPGGLLVLTVPALPSLWSEHDTLHHHFRRYERKGLEALLAQAGFRIRYLSYFNTLLFPLIWLARKAEGLLPARRAHVSLTPPPTPVNRMLRWLFGLERFGMPRFSYPVGVSLIAVAERRAL